MMRIKLFFCLIFFLLTSVANSLVAQTRSEVKVKYGWLPFSYFIHTIQKNETIGALAQTYHVTTAQIVEANPNIEDIQKIKAGQKILIPNFVEFEAQYPISEWDLILYKANGKEKLKSIAKQYKAEVKDIKNINKGIDNKPQEGTGVLIPVRKNANAPKVAEQPKRNEVGADTNTKNSDSRNPALSFDWGTKPVEDKSSESNGKNEDCKSYNYNVRKQAFSVSLLLPLYLSDDKSDYKRDNSGLYFLEGALLAIEKIKKEGLSVNLNIIDVSDKNDLTKALTSKELEKSDLIIGPFSMSELKPLAAYAQKNEIAMVVPYEPKGIQLAESNPFIFQVYPTDDVIFRKMVSERIDEDTNPVLVLPKAPDSTMAANYRKVLKERFGDYKEYVHEMGQPSRNNSLTGQLSKVKKNMLFVCSNKEAFVSDLMDRLQVCKQSGYPVSVYGRAQWLNFKIIDIARFYDLDLHLAHPFHVDYANNDVKQFIRTYRLNYNNEPTQYAFLGYDVASYFLQAMKKYGPSFAPCLSDFPATLLQSRYQFKQVGDKGGYVNSDAFMLQYTSDMDVVRK